MTARRAEFIHAESLPRLSGNAIGVVSVETEKQRIPVGDIIYALTFALFNAAVTEAEHHTVISNRDANVEFKFVGKHTVFPPALYKYAIDTGK